MKSRNTFAFIMSVLVLLASPTLIARAQDGSSQTTPQGQGPHRGPRPDFGLANLNLTDAQKAQIESIRKSERDQIMAVRNDSTLTQDQQREKARSIFESSRQQIFNVLTPQQQETLKNERHERGGPRGFRGGPGRDRGPLADLGLTDQQKAQLKSIHESAMQQIEAVRNDSSLTADQRQAKLKSIHDATEQQAAAVLTPEQKQKLEERHHNRPGGFGPRRGGPGGGPQTQKP
jgi:Spy/CpxP family protein refolding chaperone